VFPTDINLESPTPWGAEGPRIERLDVRSRDDVTDAVDQIKPDFIAHLAAETSLEVCDLDEPYAYATNTLGTKLMALAARRIDVPLVYISTAGVFDGTKTDGPYHEWDAPNPINLYGKTKLEGELLVENFLDRYYILRAGWMVGGGPGKDHKFVARMLNQINEGKTTLHAVGDKFGTPTYVPDFAACFAGLIETESYGRYHMACEGEGSRYDVAARILEVLGLTDEIELVEVDSEFFAKEFPANRPRSEIMQNLHLELQGLNTMRPWQIALGEYLERNFVLDLRDSAPLDASYAREIA
jgi:dTDP-4-dehydrorhamnose reductase